MLEKFYSKQKMNFMTVYLHRIIRLMPAIVLVAFAIITFWIPLRSGPIYE